MGVNSAFYGEEVAACVILILAPNAEWDESKARERLLKSLAKFKVPAYFIVYEPFPMFASGKIDGMGLVREVCGCPHFEEEGTSAEAQAAWIMADSWHRKAVHAS